MSSTEHFDQGALARPVFTQQCNALSSIQVKINTFEGMHTGKAFVNRA